MKARKILTIFLAAVTLSSIGVESIQNIAPISVQAKSQRHRKIRRHRHIRKIKRRKKHARNAHKLFHRIKGIGGVAGSNNDFYAFQKSFYYCNGVKMTLPLDYDYYGFGKGDTQVLITTITNNSKHPIKIGDFVNKHVKITSRINQNIVIPIKDNLVSPYAWRNDEPNYMNRFNTVLYPKHSIKVAFGQDHIDMFDDARRLWCCSFYDNHSKLLASPVVYASYSNTYEN